MSPLDERIAALAARFTARAPEERAGLRDALDRGDTAGLIERTHKLAGIAGMFGHHAIGEAALAVEDAARAGEDYSGLARDLLEKLGAL